MPRHDARLVPAAAAAWGCAALTIGGRSRDAMLAMGVLVAVAATVAVWVAVRSRRRPAAQFARACAPFAVPAAASAIALLSAQHTVHGERLWAHELESAGTVTVTVRIESESRPLAGGDARWWVDAEVLGWTQPGFTASDCGGAPEVGERCVSPAGGTLAAVVDVPLDRGDVAVMSGAVSAGTWGSPVMWEAHVDQPRSDSWVAQWRERFRDATEGLPDRQRGLVRGMILGETIAMPTRQVEAMRVAGLAHLTAVSGAHFAIVLGAVAAAARWRRLPRVATAAVVLGVAVLFATVVGPEPSVLRAFAMACAVALATAWGRPARGLPALAAGALTLLILEPALALRIGFGMSVAAVAAIVLWAPRVAHLLARVLPPHVARAASVPVVAQAAVTPFLVSMGAGLTPYAVVANVVAGVAVLPVMAAGMTALVLAAVSSSWALVPAWVAGKSAQVIAMIAEATAGAPGARVPWLDGPAGPLAAGMGVAAAVVATLRVGTGWRVLGAAVGAGALLVGAAWPALTARDHGVVLDDWDVVACDVGQGDMMLLRAGPSSAVVIDAGPDPDVARSCLESYRVTEIPLLVITHPHEDHDGGVSGVMGVARPALAWVSDAAAGGAAARALATEGVPMRVPTLREAITVGDVALRVVSTLHAGGAAAANDASIGVIGVASGTSVIALGDLELEGQEAVALALGGPVPIDVVKVAHHGSAVQSPHLADLIDARIAVFSAGADNRHGHPAASALDLYGANAQIARTDQCGSIEVAHDESGLRWSGCRTEVAG